MRCEEIVDRLEEDYPLECAEEWDNPGLQVGRRNRVVKKIFVSLDADESSIRQAVEWGADMLVTHHPLLFRSINRVTDDTVNGRRILALVENDISCYALHTNFDVLGMARLNRKILQLRNTRVLDVTRENDGVLEGIGRIGDLPKPMTLRETANFVRQQFGLEAVRCYGLEQDEGRGSEERILVTKVAVCGGSGKSVVEKAIQEGAQVLVTGDIDYHTGIDAMAQGLFIIDAGHYGTEYCFIDFMTRKLKALFPDCEVKGAKIIQPFRLVGDVYPEED